MNQKEIDQVLACIDEMGKKLSDQAFSKMNVSTRARATFFRCLCEEVGDYYEVGARGFGAKRTDIAKMVLKVKVDVKEDIPDVVVDKLCSAMARLLVDGARKQVEALHAVHIIDRDACFTEALGHMMSEIDLLI